MAEKTAARARGKRARSTKAVPSMAVRRTCFLEALRQTGNVARAAREAGLATSTAYAHRARSATFAQSWDAAIAEAMDELEATLMERARTGVEKPVFFRGAQVGAVRTYSDALAMFLLRARRPEVYDRLSGGGQREPAEMTQDEAKAEVLRRLDLLATPPSDADEANGEDIDDGSAA